jgi:hypothetical protein
MSEYRERYLRVIREDRRQKIRVKGTQTQRYGDRTYHSKAEARYAQELDFQIKAGEISSWEPQYKVSLDVNGQHIANYFVDFKVVMPDGGIELHEVKGFATEIFRLKRLLLEATVLHDHPEIKYVVVRV